jgi:phosphoglycolate phosphatase-like HAD superfamily hydrolase
MTGNRGPRLLLLDFDGVIADSVEECLALTWYTDRAAESGTQLTQQFRAVPETFRTRFHQLRPYARTLDDFYVAKIVAAQSVRNQSEFDSLKAEIPQQDRKAFAASATALRERWRSDQREQWLAAHTIFDGIAATLERYSGDVFVITAKDADSSVEILEHFGLDRHLAGVVGDVSDKALAAQCLCLGRGVEPADSLFIDDNLINVDRVQSVGVSSRWARWGWTTAEHETSAAARGLEPIDLSDLATL